MTSAEAIRFALDAGEPHESREYRITATESSANVLKLKLTRLIGLAERSHETHATFSEHADVDMFKQQCARAWQWLADQHRVARQETGI